MTALALTEDEHSLLLYLYLRITQSILNALKFFFSVANEHHLSDQKDSFPGRQSNHDKTRFCFLIYLHGLSKRNIARLESKSKKH